MLTYTHTFVHSLVLPASSPSQKGTSTLSCQKLLSFLSLVPIAARTALEDEEQGKVEGA